LLKKPNPNPKLRNLKGETDMANGGDIIIKGGRSAEIEFDHELFKRSASNPRKRKHHTLKITRIVVSGDANFDSNEIPDGFNGEIRISCD
jgi:hypothetical protein